MNDQFTDLDHRQSSSYQLYRRSPCKVQCVLNRLKYPINFTSGFLTVEELFNYRTLNTNTTNESINFVILS